MPSQKLYTLDEAREILKRERCEKRGYHMWSIKMGEGKKPQSPIALYCPDCDESYLVNPA